MKSYAKPVGYIRVSREDEADDRPADEKRAGQVNAIQALAERNGYSGTVHIYDDWDKSADEAKEHKRVAFAEMLAAIERGEVSAVYARSLDRLYRSMSTFIKLTKVAKAYGVRIETEREGILGGDGSPMAQAFASITATFAELELETAKARARSRVKRQREAGIRLGVAPFGGNPGENVKDVLDAFRETGSYQGAARLLIEHNVASRRGLGLWEGTTVRRIVMREAPELVPQRPVARVKTVLPHPFARLLVCPHDGSFLTAMAKPGGSAAYWCRLGTRAARRCPKHKVIVTRRQDTAYDCPRGHVIGMWDTLTDHPAPWTVAESFITPFVKRMTASLMGHARSVTRPDGTEADIEALQARRRRYALLFGEGDLSEDVWHVKRNEIDAEMALLTGAQRASLTFRMGLDWSMGPAELNITLRELIHHIVLGPDMRPIGVVWRVEPTDEEVFDREAGSYEALPHPKAVKVDGGWSLMEADL